MSTYLTFYLQPRSRKNKDGVEETPKPMPLLAYSGNSGVFSIFRKEIPEIAYENEEETSYTELSVDDVVNILSCVEQDIAKTKNQIQTIRKNLRFIGNKGVIEDKLNTIEGLSEEQADKECVAQEIQHILYLVREIGYCDSWAAFEKVLMNIG